jgi:hypothetical protein
MDKFLKADMKEPHTLFLRPGRDSPFKLFISSHTDFREGLPSFLEICGSGAAPSLDFMACVW